MSLYPSVSYRRINTALKVAVPYLKKLVPPENPADRNFVSSEHRENLPRCMVSINLLSGHCCPLSRSKVRRLAP